MLDGKSVTLDLAVVILIFNEFLAVPFHGWDAPNMLSHKLFSALNARVVFVDANNAP